MDQFGDAHAGEPEDPWASGILPRIQLVKLDPAAIDALATGDLDKAEGLASVPLGPFFVLAASVHTWRIRSDQLAATPTDANWITRVIYDPGLGVSVGQAGFHGPPDEAGMVEVGYSVDPAYRRRGYARAALQAMIARARAEPSVAVVRASIRPDNLPSHALVAQFGFAPVGEQWDDEDGLETILELPVGYRPMPESMQTERLSLRLRSIEDAPWNLELLGEHDGGTTLSLDQAEQRLVRQQFAARATGIGFLTIRRRPDEEAMGYCGLLIGRGSFDEPELAYELLRRHHGHGYATEAAAAVLEAAFATGRRRIWSTVGAWNAPSFRVLEKLGFQRHHTAVNDRGEVVYLVRDSPDGS